MRTRTRRRGAVVVAAAALLRSSVPDALSVGGVVDIGALIELLGEALGAALGAGVAVTGAALLAAADESRIIADESAGAAELVRSVVVSRASGSLVVGAGLVVGLVVGDGVGLDGEPGVPVRSESIGDGCVDGVPGDVDGDVGDVVVVGDVGEVVGEVGDVGDVGVWADAAAAPNVSASAAPRLSERLRIGRISWKAGRRSCPRARGVRRSDESTPATRPYTLAPRVPAP